MSTTGAALRLSRRTIARSPGRAALILAMIGLPVLVVTALATLLSTLDDSASGPSRPLGSADALVWGDHAWSGVTQEPTGDGYGWSPGEHPRPFTAVEIGALFGRGSRVIPLREERTAYETPETRDVGTLRELDLRDPLARDAYRLLDGRLPQAAGEIVVTRKILDAGGRMGGTLLVTRRRRPMRIVGVVLVPSDSSGTRMVALPGSVIPPRAANTAATDKRAWLVDAPRPVTWKDVRRLNGSGLIVVSRAVLADPPPGKSPAMGAESTSSGGALPVIVPLMILMFVLEVVLLAGPAFAVGLRRRRAELALIAAQGGTPGQLRAVVLADGLVLGMGAATAGAVAGIGVAVAVMPWAERVFESVMTSLSVPWAAVAVIVVLGTASGLAAALAPAAQASRTDIVAVLAGRSERRRDRVGWPLLGLVLLAGGVAAALMTPRHGVTWVFVAAVLTQFGMVAVIPWLVGGAGRLAGRLPLPLRFAARDAARHRGRTAPAVAAVMTATALVTALTVAGTSLYGRASLDYRPAAPPGATIISRDQVPEETWHRVRDAARRTLPAGVPLIEVALPTSRNGALMLTSISSPGAENEDEASIISPDLSGMGGVLIGDRALLRFALGRDDPSAIAALEAGRAVVLNPAYVRKGKIQLSLTPQYSGGRTEDLTLPAVGIRATGEGWARVVMSPKALEGHDLSVESRLLLVDPARYRPSRAVQDRLAGGIGAITTHVGVRVERGFEQDYTGMMLLLAAAAVVMVLGATFVATRLAATDARPELTTLAEVGASPGSRRAVVAGQAFVIAALGVASGLLAGLVPGIAATWPASAREAVSTAYGADGVPVTLPQHEGPVVGLPWLFLATLLITLPLLAALTTALLGATRPSARRRPS
ncbi:FtsX-like permease family protein [Sphaerisporangium sp. NPDC088356]|uniref:FtsX-like permease family protein n=1 Tax=Sphaerisporangium sp. NPDC088356 TaxID=3154871 RepID=UPI00343E8B25